tara:strand:+ start:986 stop:1270 length:285 start_codon:yes stop_codon:yes gene_type:complete
MEVSMLEFRISVILFLISAEQIGTKYVLKNKTIKKNIILINASGLNNISLLEFPVDPNIISSLSNLSLLIPNIMPKNIDIGIVINDSFGRSKIA